VAFKDLQKLVQSQSNQEYNQVLQRLRNKPFWIWDQQQHKREDIKTNGDCCFNHIIGLPRKDGKTEKTMFDYEKLLYDSLLKPGFMNTKCPTKPREGGISIKSKVKPSVCFYVIEVH
jgi:hypothetical protein